MTPKKNKFLLAYERAQMKAREAEQAALAAQKICPHLMVVGGVNRWEHDNGYGKQSWVEGPRQGCIQCGLIRKAHWFHKILFPNAVVIQGAMPSQLGCVEEID